MIATRPPEGVPAVELWQQILLGALALLVVFWFRPGIKAMLERSKEAPKDWTGALIPIGLVVLFVFLLIALARS
jgi:hypothetical protein